MTIKKKRINNVEKYLADFQEHAMLVVMVGVREQHEAIINALEITNQFSSVLPKTSFGNACFYNAEGKIKKRKDLPMESYILELPYELQDR